MGLRQQVTSALKQAMKDKDSARLATLRLINAAIKDQDIARRTADGETDLSDDDIRAIMARMIKQRRESVRAYEEGGRLDLAERESREIEVITEFMPRQLRQDEVARAVDKAISETGASSIRDMGRIMGLLKERHAGQMDFGAIGPMVKDRLG
ncbi:MAG: GatB/YqeY domain-containing protein [Roseovarius sp.]|nr:GatB/YqeY domain-containing protein [Roseovarius sp.]